MNGMQAVTIYEPWAGLIMAGAKDVENRSQPYRHVIGHRVAIHVARKRARIEDVRYVWARFGISLPWPYPPDTAGKVLGSCRVVGVLKPRTHLDADYANRGLAEAAESPWWERRCWGLVLRDVLVYREPIPARGWQGVWWWTPEVPMVELEAAGVRVESTWKEGA